MRILTRAGEVFYEAWERLRDLLRQCLHHGITKHEITQIFYDGLGAPDQYLLDAASGATFMSKYEDEVLELIELVAENSHHHAAKSFEGRSAPIKGGMLDAKTVETGMLLDKIEWVSLEHVVPKKVGITVTSNDKGEEIQMLPPTKWSVYIDY